MAAGERSRRWPSSELPVVRPRRPPGDMVGDGARLGETGNRSRGGGDNMTTAVTRRTHGGKAQNEGKRLRRAVAVAAAVFVSG